MTETCSVVNQFCTSPADLYPPVKARGMCFMCGRAVCAQCSTRRKYLHYGVQRLCDNCQEELGYTRQVVLRYWRRAGRTKAEALEYISKSEKGLF